MNYIIFFTSPLTPPQNQAPSNAALGHRCEMEREFRWRWGPERR